MKTNTILPVLVEDDHGYGICTNFEKVRLQENMVVMELVSVCGLGAVDG